MNLKELYDSCTKEQLNPPTIWLIHPRYLMFEDGTLLRHRSSEYRDWLKLYKRCIKDKKKYDRHIGYYWRLV